MPFLILFALSLGVALVCLEQRRRVIESEQRSRRRHSLARWLPLGRSWME